MSRVWNSYRYSGWFVQEPFGPVEEVGQVVDVEAVVGQRRADRHQPDQRLHLDRDVRAVGEMQDVVEVGVLLVPEPGVVRRPGDGQEVLEELGRDVLVGRGRAGRAAAPCPADPARTSPSRRWSRPVPGNPFDGGRVERSSGAMLSRPMKPPWNRLFPPWSLLSTHQVKLISSLWKILARKVKSVPPSSSKTLQRRPGVDRRIDVGEVPFVGRDLAVGMHVPLAQQQDELRLGEGGVDVRQRHAVEGQVPGREPRVLPRVGHQDDLVVVQVQPVAVADLPATRRWRRLGRDRRRASA